MLPKVAEVRNEYTNDDGYVHIDVWETDNDDEPGKTVAIVCTDTHKVYYIDKLYEMVDEVKQAVQEVLDELNSKTKL
jgi:hypothetical protein